MRGGAGSGRRPTRPGRAKPMPREATRARSGRCWETTSTSSDPSVTPPSPACYARADVFALPSVAEGYGIVCGGVGLRESPSWPVRSGRSPTLSAMPESWSRPATTAPRRRPRRPSRGRAAPGAPRGECQPPRPPAPDLGRYANAFLAVLEEAGAYGAGPARTRRGTRRPSRRPEGSIRPARWRPPRRTPWARLRSTAPPRPSLLGVGCPRTPLGLQVAAAARRHDRHHPVPSKRARSSGLRFGTTPTTQISGRELLDGTGRSCADSIGLLAGVVDGITAEQPVEHGQPFVEHRTACAPIVLVAEVGEVLCWRLSQPRPQTSSARR